MRQILMGFIILCGCLVLSTGQVEAGKLVLDRLIEIESHSKYWIKDATMVDTDSNNGQ